MFETTETTEIRRPPDTLSAPTFRPGSHPVMIIKRILGTDSEPFDGSPMMSGPSQPPVMMMGGPGLPPPMILDFIMKVMNNMPMQNAGHVQMITEHKT